MNKAIRITLFLLLINSLLIGQNREEWFSKGVEYYKARQYDSAVVSFEKIIRQGYESGELYFNLGNAYYRKGDVGHAILNYYKAKRFLGNDPDLVYNLQMAEKLIENPILVPRPMILFRIWNSFLDIFSINTTGWILLLSLFFLLVVSIMIVWVRSEFAYIWVKRLRKIGFFFVLVMTILLIIQMNRYRQNSFSIIVEQQAILRSEPIDNGTQLLIIPVGTRVKNIKVINSWVEIELPDGNRGWVIQEKLRNI